MREGGVSRVAAQALVDASIQGHEAASDPHTGYQRESALNQVNGYAGLDGSGRVAAGQAPAKSVYATGGGQALAAADVGAPPTSRQVASGAGLSGGGDLSTNRTLQISAFTGCMAKDYDPVNQPYNPGQTVAFLTYDAGGEGWFVPTGVRLPATVHADIRTEALMEFSDGTTATFANANTGATLDATMQDLAELLMAKVDTAGTNNGRRLQKVTLRARNVGVAQVTVDLGWYRVRAYVFPRGGGGAL